MPSPMKPTTWPLFLKRLYDSLLVRGREPRKNVGWSTASDNSASDIVSTWPAEQDFFGIKADFAADLARDKIVVAGEHFHCDAVLVQSGDGFGCRLLGRVEKCQIAGQHQVVFIGFRVGRAFLYFFVGDRQHAESVAVQFIQLLRGGRRPGSAPSERFRLRIRNERIW